MLASSSLAGLVIGIEGWHDHRAINTRAFGAALDSVSNGAFVSQGAVIPSPRPAWQWQSMIIPPPARIPVPCDEPELHSPELAVLEKYGGAHDSRKRSGPDTRTPPVPTT
jgi:hypothetical protein